MTPIGRAFRRGNRGAIPLTLSPHTFTSLELQRLWTLLKVHSIELHAKLLRGCALTRTWARS